MTDYKKLGILLTTLFALVVLLSIPAGAGSVADFYKGKTITYYVGAGAGGNFGLYARTFEPYFVKHIPGQPKIIVNFMPGGGGRKLAAYMHNVAPKDGTAIAMTIHSVPFWQRIEPEKAKFNAAEWHWLGSIASLNNVLAIINTAPATTLEGARKSEVIIGASSKASSGYIDPALVNRYLGTKLRFVFGYRGLRDLNKALEGGEIQGQCTNLLSWKIEKADWIKTGKIRFLVQFGIEQDPDFPDLPLLVDLVEGKEAKDVVRFAATPNKMARSIFAPSGTPKDRVEALRAAFEATMTDPGFLAEAKKRRIPVTPTKGEAIEKLVKGLLDAPPQIVSELQEIIGK